MLVVDTEIDTVNQNGGMVRVGTWEQNKGTTLINTYNQNNGLVTVQPSATINNAILSETGSMHISASGTVHNLQILSNATVTNGGIVNNINDSGTLIVSTDTINGGGIYNNTTISNGNISNVTFSNTTLPGSSVIVNAFSNTIIDSGDINADLNKIINVNMYNGAIIQNTTLRTDMTSWTNNIAYLRLGSTGTNIGIASNMLITNYGKFQINNGSAVNTTVQSGGSMLLYGFALQNATANIVHIKNKGVVGCSGVSSHTANMNDVIVSSGGSLTVGSSSIVTNLIVNVNGTFAMPR